ncbi:MAG: hypothetical protein WBK19_10450 [Azonexus sp.]
MNDLFASIEEAKDERQAIQMADGITTTADELHRFEVITIVNRYFPDGDPKPFFAEVEKKRGKESADKPAPTAARNGQSVGRWHD